MTAPAIPATDTGNDGMEGMGALEATIASTMRDSHALIGDEQAVTNRPRNEKGQFVSMSGEDPANEPKGAGEWNVIPDGDETETQVVEGATAPAATETVPTDAEGAEAQAPVIPEGHIALPALDPAKVQGFKVLDTEGGEIVVPDLRFEVNFRNKQTGAAEPRMLDVPQLVNYARMGVYNHEREQQYETSQRELVQRRSMDAQIEQAFKDRDARYERLLSDPEFLAKELTRYDDENTPEARAEKEQRQRAEERERFELEKMAHQSSVFIDNRLTPALDKLIARFPTLTQEEVADKVVRYAEPFMQNGVLPPNHHMTVAAYVVHDLYPWAEQVHTDREASKPKPTPEVKETKPPVDPEKAKLQAKNQKLRRVATAPRLQGGNQPQGKPQKQAVPTSNRGTEDFIVGRSLGATLGKTG